jgi:hypothetical protein
MAVTIFDSQLKLNITDGSAKPDVFINNQVGHIICHLTKGFDLSTYPTVSNPRSPLQLTCR